MTVTVDPKAMLAALTRATSAIVRDKKIPILTCVKITADGEQMQIVATDLDRHITVRIEAEGECDPICIEYARLIGIAASVKDRGSMTIVTGKDSAVISSGRSRFTVATLSADMWPKMEEPTWSDTFEVDGPKFARLLTSMEPAIPTEVTRFYLNGVFIAPGSVPDPRSKDTLVGVATDGHKLCARHIEVTGLSPSRAGMIVPRVACSAISKLFGEEKLLAISCNDRKLMIDVGGTAYITKLIEGTYPDWRRVVPTPESACSYDLAELTAAAQAVAAAKSAEKLGKAVRLIFREGETELQATDFNNPAFSGTDVVRHSDLSNPEASEVGVNVDYLIEMLPTLDAETIEIAPSGNNGPIIIRGATFTDRVAVIMPQRV